MEQDDFLARKEQILNRNSAKNFKEFNIENELKKSFRAVKVVRPEIYKGKKMIVYKCFEGSSKFNTQECNKLIDVLLSWCSELDIKMESDIYEV